MSPLANRINKYILPFIISGILLGLSACGKKAAQSTEIPLLIITDFGRDVDDAQAFAYLAGEITGLRIEALIPDALQREEGQTTATPLRIAGVICTGYVPTLRAKTLELFLNLYDLSVPIALQEPEKTAEQIKTYFSTHCVNGKPYELTLLERLGNYPPNQALWQQMQDSAYVQKYKSPDHLIDSLLKAHPGQLRLVVLAQATQVSGYLQKHPDAPFHSVYVQGQAKERDPEGMLLPDFSAYNLREDTLAAYQLFRLYPRLPFVLVSKYDTYPHAFSKTKTEAIGQAGYAGDYLKNGAYLGLQSFLERDSAAFYKVFSLSPSIRQTAALDSLKVANNPYDLLTVMKILYSGSNWRNDAPSVK